MRVEVGIAFAAPAALPQRPPEETSTGDYVNLKNDYCIQCTITSSAHCLPRDAAEKFLDPNDHKNEVKQLGAALTHTYETLPARERKALPSPASITAALE